MRGTAGRLTRTTPLKEKQAWDIDRIAYRQCGATIDDGSNAPVTIRLTLIGPTRRVLAPWIALHWHASGVQITDLQGRVRTMAADTRTVWWDGSDWRQSLEAFPELPEGGEVLPLDQTIFDVLASHAPEQSGLIAEMRAEVPSPDLPTPGPGAGPDNGAKR